MDRFMRGFILGVICSTVKDSLNWFSYSILHFSNATYADYMSIILMGRPARTLSEIIISQIIEFGYEGLIGVLFIYFAYRTKSKQYLWFKGMFFTVGVYLFNYAIGTFFRLPLLDKVSIGTAIENLITSSIFGILLGLGVYMWGKRRGDWNEEEKPKRRSLKFKLTPSPAKKIQEHEDNKIRFKKPKKLR